MSEKEQEVTLDQLQQAVEQHESFEDFQSNPNTEKPVEEEDKGNNQESQETKQDEPQEPSNDSEGQQQQKEEGGEEQPQELSDAEFRRIVTAKFKANGTEMEVTDPQDIVRLMQYGSNYHKKMGELAPNRKLLKALQDNDLLDADKINDLIALSKKEPAAIAKFLKDNEIDTYNLPDLEETPYQRQNYVPSDSKVDFDEAIDTLSKTDTGLKAIRYLNQLPQGEMNDLFKQGLAINAMNALNEHISSGLYDRAISLLEQEKALGRVPETDNQGNRIKEIDKYFFVANHLLQEQEKQTKQSKPEPKVLGNNLQQQQQQPAVNSHKQRASIPSNQQQHSYSGMQEMITTNDFNKFDTWEDFLKAHNLQ